MRARPATRAYVMHKFVQRHWGGVLGVLLTLLVLTAATVITTLQMLEARQQRDFARTQLARAEAPNDLNDYLLRLPALLAARASTEVAAGQLPDAERDAKTAVALLEATAQPGDFSSSTGRAYLTLARVLNAEGKTTEARAVAQQAWQHLQKALGTHHPDTGAAEKPVLALFTNHRC